MNRADLSKAVLLYDQLAAAAKAKAAVFREQLDADARDEYTRQGMAPTWRLPDVGTVTLPVSSENIYLADRKALTEYAASRPAEDQAVEAVLEIQPSWLAALERRLIPVDGVAVDTATGEVIPGYAVRAGGLPMSLSIRPSSDAKSVARLHAEGLLEQFEASITGEVTE